MKTNLNDVASWPEWLRKEHYNDSMVCAATSEARQINLTDSEQWLLVLLKRTLDRAHLAESKICDLIMYGQPPIIIQTTPEQIEKLKKQTAASPFGKCPDWDGRG